MGEDVYTHGHSDVVVAAHSRRTAAEAAAFLLPRIDPGMRILDFGCGPGSITSGLAGHAAPGTVVGIDASADVIAIARERAGPAKNLEFAVASVYELPYPDGSFDAAYGHQVLQHLSAPIRALTEVRRVLKSGGLLGVRDADYGTMTHHPHYEQIERWLKMYHQVARANNGEPDAGRRLPEWVRAAGFVDLETTSSVWTYATPEERSSWAELWASRMTGSHFAGRAEELGIATREEIATIAAGWQSWAAEPGGWFAFIHGEVVAVNPE